MKPRVFVSSTIRDLQHIRDAVRDVIEELGYQPVMSEHGEVGFLPSMTAANSCYQEAMDSDLGILIIGKRYGDEDDNDEVSVTHKEFRTLHERSIPLVTLVERDIFASKTIFDASDENLSITIPGMDKPEQTFTFIEEVMRSPYNNGVSEFRHVSEVREYIKAQFGHIFGDLLRRRNETNKSELRDILSAVTALRHDINQGSTDPNSNRFLKASRYLLSDEATHYKSFLSSLCGSFDAAVQAILEHDTFDALVEAQGSDITVVPDTQNFQEWWNRNETTWAASWGVQSNAGGFGVGGYANLREGGIGMSERVEQIFRANHLSIRAHAME